MPDFATIYQHHADQYDRLVAREDYQGNILPSLQQITPCAGASVVELGAGTGRLTRLLAPFVHRIVAFDRSAHMLRMAQHTTNVWGHVSCIVADNAQLPVVSAQADLALAGWSFGHATEWEPTHWRERIGAALAEMRRVVRPGGVMIILETLGTGRNTPEPPSAELATYYAWLEQAHGWQRRWIRTDYRFTSVDEANMLTGFFFGAPSPSQLQPDGRAIVPECTGIWWRQVD